ncbi:MAG: PepSY-like domain-containing protein [Planctomycetota bacterium]|jgi:hypothetical protein
MSKMMRLFVVICICITGLSVSAVEGVSLFGLPVVVQEVVKREFAGARVTEIDDDDYDGIEVYKIEAKTADGKELMIKVGLDGTLYQKEIEIGLQEVPKAVLAKFRKELGNADNDVDEVKRISKQGRIQYNIEAEISGKDIELKIAADGTLLEKDVDDDDDGDSDGGGVLAGILFDSMDFTNPRSGLDLLPSLDMSWGADRGKGWSARWIGGINGPYFGDVTFTVETNGKVRVTVAGYVLRCNRHAHQKRLSYGGDEDGQGRRRLDSNRICRYRKPGLPAYLLAVAGAAQSDCV